MNWTFGIVTAGKSPYIKDVIQSIRDYAPKDHEIIVVGGDEYRSKISSAQDFIPSNGADTWIPFDETVKKGWISKKKNIIAQHASNENICLLHDYVALVGGWAQGALKFGDDWNTCTNRILNKDGHRFRDWCIIDNDGGGGYRIDNAPLPPTARLLTYDHPGIPRWQYYSGAYFCVKRRVLRDVPIDEDRLWGQGEDVEWCRRVWQSYGDRSFSFNPYSVTRFLKQKERPPWEGLPPLRP
jgi:GT2 family glycosyltransferase